MFPRERILVRRALLVAVPAAVLSAGLLVALRGVEHGSPAPPPAAAAEEPLLEQPAGPPPAPPTPLRIETGSLGRGTTLSAALGRLAVEPARVQRVATVVDGVLDLRKLPAQTGLAVGRDAGGVLRTIGIRAERERFVRLTFSEDDAAPTVEVVDLPVTAHPSTLAGEVSTCVDQAISHSEHGPRLTLAFAEIFQWDIDLLIEPRPGDRVRVVYESREFGPLPHDLPPYGGQVDREGQSAGLGRILAADYEGRLASSKAFWVERDSEHGGYYDEDGEPLQKTFLKSPLTYRRISSGFSRARRHPITRKVVPHHGVDFAAPSGTPVAASADGRVISAGWDGPLGRAVRIRHGSNYETVYGHLQAFARGIRRGAEVRQNQVIGYVGSSGRATGPHLHYTLIERGRPVDPMHFENPPAEALPPELRPRLADAIRAWSPLLAAADPRRAEIVASATRRAGAGG